MHRLPGQLVKNLYNFFFTQSHTIMKKLNQFLILQKKENKSENIPNLLGMENGEVNMPTPDIPIDENNIASMDIETLHELKENLQKELQSLDQKSPQSKTYKTSIFEKVSILSGTIIHYLYFNYESLLSLTEKSSQISAVNRD